MSHQKEEPPTLKESVQEALDRVPDKVANDPIHVADVMKTATGYYLRTNPSPQTPATALAIPYLE